MRKYIFAVLLLVAQLSVADWKLNNKASTLSFVSTKNASISEVNTFTNLSGEVKKNGATTLKISLNSVETNISIRNDRMKQFLFETDRFKEAVIETTVDLSKVDALLPGSSIDMAVKASLSMHGVTEDVDAKLRVIKLQNDGIAVSTVEPIIISTGLFGFQPGLDKLKEIAKLDSITTTVPVSLNLKFDSR